MQSAQQPAGHARGLWGSACRRASEHLPLQGVVSVETPKSRFSLPKRCNPDNCGLAFARPGKDVRGSLF